MFRLESIELILVVIILVLALIMDLQINAFSGIDLLQKIIFVSLNLFFVSIASLHLYRVIGEPRVYFTNLFLNAFRENRNRILVRLILDTSILPSLALAIYMFALELNIGFGKKSLVMLLQPALSILLAYMFYSIILIVLTIISRNLVLSSITTGLTATVIVYFDTRFLNQIIIVENPDIRVLLINSTLIGTLLILTLLVVSRRRS